MNDDLLYDVALKHVMLKKKLDSLLRVIDAIVDAFPHNHAEEIRERMLLAMTCNPVNNQKHLSGLSGRKQYEENNWWQV